MVKTILVVDDSPTDRTTYRRFLCRDDQQSYQFVEFDNGEEALDWCCTKTADVILLDYCLIEMDGLEFLRRLRQQHPDAILPVILLTGMGNTDIAVEAMKLGAQEYFDKGKITPESLPQLVRSVLQQVQLRQKLIRQQKQNQIINEIALRMRQSLEAQNILDRATQDICQFLQVDRVLVYQLTPEWEWLLVSEAVVSESLSLVAVQIQDNCFQQGAGVSYLHGHTWAMSDIQQANLTDCHRELLEQYFVRANLVVPILQQVPPQADQTCLPTLWGLLIAHHCFKPHHWQEEEISFLQQIAIQLSGAIQQATLFHQLQTELAERKQAEIALQESEARLRHAIQNAPIPIKLYAGDGEILLVNQTWTDLTGYSHSEIPTLAAWMEQAYGERTDEIQTLINKQFSQPGQTHAGKFSLTTKSGETLIWDFYRAQLGALPDGRQFMISMAVDCTKQRLAQIQLQAILDTSEVVFYLKDQEGKYLLINQQYELLTHLDRSEVLGKTDFELFPDETAQVFWQHDQHVLTTGQSLQFEETVQLPNGCRTYLAVKFPLRDTSGKIYAMCGMSTDITELKQIQTALQQSNEQLQAANQDLERANQVKDAFLRMISHELRTPLNPILGMAEGLQEKIFGPLNDRQQRSISIIYSNGQSLLTLINKILDLLNLETDKVTLNRHMVSVKDLCEVSLEIVSPQATAKSIQLQLCIAPEITIIQGDSERMQQILIHLLENAIKFTPPHGTVRLTVQSSSNHSCSSSSASTSHVQFSIEDTGIGIAPENLQNLFQSFMQIDDRLNRAYEGLGIGLALVQRLVELHGGDITVESQLDQGSCFTVSLPHNPVEPVVPGMVGA